MQHQLQHPARHKYQVCKVEAELEKSPANAIYHQAVLPSVLANCAVDALPQLRSSHGKSHGYSLGFLRGEKKQKVTGCDSIARKE